MSDAKESEWMKHGRPEGPMGQTKGPSLASGLSEHYQIKNSLESMGQGHGQGERPKANAKTTVKSKGKTYRFV